MHNPLSQDDLSQGINQRLELHASLPHPLSQRGARNRQTGAAEDSFLSVCLPHHGRHANPLSGSEPFLSSFQYWKSKTERPIPIKDVQVSVENRKSVFFVDTKGGVEPLDHGKAKEVIEKLGRTGAYTHDLGRYWVIRTLLHQPAILKALMPVLTLDAADQFPLEVIQCGE
ncbi:hypothetical protein SAMN04490208_3263 [Pseudomonas poae]|uniref:Uncharacterized protein n=1 Tax=Pseudomonas poae TaxID=200451 RepID=A0ABY0RM98_9PSED|nr:hypothetical protein SAMN04490208_3263 [Pseudomonas poae]